ncbi:rRNA-processing protein fcf2-like [Cynara cardunculus var. scolymus]|uniref:rRNA-processing protein fcf2-like n=1 Tax=Cynara cardunculus var. scolymus TaxID=59895 RepID=UPI000D626531|nr:rRNA-processing protein fcf2-like [Cynara cardunculus var. scolymus]
MMFVRETLDCFVATMSTWVLTFSFTTTEQDLSKLILAPDILPPNFALELPSLLFGTKGGSNDKFQNVSESSLVYKPKSELIDGLFVPPNDPKKVNKLLKKQVKDTTGKNWFDMPAPTLTPELKKDLKLLKLRNVIDPKRHYKKGDSKLNIFPKYFQVGTVVEPVSEYFTSRLTKKERKPTLADELLSDQSLKVYRKRKVREIEEKNQPGGVDKWKIKGKSSWKRAKQRRH